MPDDDYLTSRKPRVPALSTVPVRTRVAAGAICCLGLLAFADARVRAPGADEARPPAAQSAAPTASADGGGGGGGGQGGGAGAAAVPVQADPEPADPDVADPAAVEPEPADAGPPEIVNPGPVAGLSQVQVDNAQAIVRTGRDLGLPRRALVIAVATAMQESTLLNRASEVLPESKNYPHQGTGWDHDSVGLFQQRTSSGWGPVASLMDPAYASQRFYEALLRVPGWQYLRLTEAAQAVQVSAYPEHYARHEAQAEQVVAAIMPADR
nr:peptidase M23 [Micromonospora sp. DSM 115978]